jgi:hypothetical protein
VHFKLSHLFWLWAVGTPVAGGLTALVGVLTHQLQFEVHLAGNADAKHYCAAESCTSLLMNTSAQAINAWYEARVKLTWWYWVTIWHTDAGSSFFSYQFNYNPKDDCMA